MTVAQEISVDIFEEKYFEYLNVKQADNVGRVLITTITAKDETLKPDKDTEQAVFRALKPDGTSVIDPATIREDGKVEIALSAQTLACDGQVEADISIIRGETILSTATFYIQVARAPFGKTIKSENEFLLLIEAKDAAEDAAKRAEEAAEQTAADKQATSELAEQAAGSAGAAAGSASQAAGSEKAAGEHATAADIAKASAEAAALLAQSWARGETGSRDGEDEDNAKYYAAQALIAALQAAEAAEDAQRVAQGAVGYYKTPELLREKHPSAEDGNWAIVGSTDTIWVWDSDSGDWTNSGNKIDLSQYYTRTEVDDLLTGLVITVNGKTGTVTLTKEDIGLSDVDNTPDAEKTVAIAGKVANALNFTGASTVSYDGSKEQTVNIPAAPTAAAMFLAAHPVGSYYWSSTATSPASLFGGTWTQITGRFVLAAGNGYNVGATSGAATHTHGAGTYGAEWTMGGTYNNSGSSTGKAAVINLVYRYENTAWTSNWISDVLVSSSQTPSPASSYHYSVPIMGSSASASTMPPYIVAYCWRRTA